MENSPLSDVSAQKLKGIPANQWSSMDRPVDDCRNLVRLLASKKGLLVCMPQEQGKDNKWYDQVICKEASVFDALSKVVMDFYMSECAYA